MRLITESASSASASGLIAVVADHGCMIDETVVEAHRSRGIALMSRMLTQPATWPSSTTGNILCWYR